MAKKTLIWAVVGLLLAGCAADPDPVVNNAGNDVVEADVGQDVATADSGHDVVEPDVRLEDIANDADEPDADDTSEPAACPESHSITVTEASQLRNVAACRTIPGSLVIEVSLGVQSIALPLLEDVGEELVIRLQDATTSLDLSGLRTIGVALVIDENHALDELHLPLLTSVGQRLAVITNNALTSVRFDVLGMVGEDLVSFLVPSVNIWNNALLTTLEMPELKEVFGGIGFNVHQNPRLATLALPSLEATSELTLANMSALQSVSFPSLTSIGGLLLVISNSALPTCQAQALATSASPARVCIMMNASDNCADNISGCS
ncbi:MAG: hypothetical protein H0U74_19640 [Bradymonadaceae bacterium]|nr:hypothetical protein [Lujinxingiaceae bacterium]